MVCDGKPIKQVEIKNESNFSLRIPLTGGRIEVLADQFFVPAQHRLSDDARPLVMADCRDEPDFVKRLNVHDLMRTLQFWHSQRFVFLSQREEAG